MSWLTRVRPTAAWAAVPAAGVALAPAVSLAGAVTLAVALAPAVTGASRARLMAAGTVAAAEPTDRARVTDRSGCMGEAPSGEGLVRTAAPEHFIIRCRCCVVANQRPRCRNRASSAWLRHCLGDPEDFSVVFPEKSSGSRPTRFVKCLQGQL